MAKKTLVLKQHHHHWVIAGNDAASSGGGEVVDAECKTCGATTTFLNYLDWSVIEKKKPVKEEGEEVDILSTEE